MYHNYSTSKVLEKVANKLAYFVDAQGDSKFVVIPDFYDILYDDAHNGDRAKPTISSILIRCVHQLITDVHECIAITRIGRRDPWHIQRNYTGQIYDYEYAGYKLQTSILEENTVGSSKQYVYLVINFTFERKKPCYYVERFLTTEIPLLEKKNAADIALTSKVISKVTSIWTRFCSKVRDKGEFETKEFHKAALFPNLDPPKKSVGKKKQTDAPSSSRTAKRVEKGRQYELLEKLRETAGDLNDARKILGVLRAICLEYGEWSGGSAADVWPGEENYAGETIELWFPTICETETTVGDDGTVTETVNQKHTIFYLSVLRNEAELFVSMRVSGFPAFCRV